MSRSHCLNQYRKIVKITKHLLWKLTGNKGKWKFLHSSDDDISITFMTTVDTRFTAAQLPTFCFRALTNSNSPTVTKKTRNYHRLTTATDAKFTGNPERTCRSAASHLTIGSCSYSERFFLRRSSHFVNFLHILKISSFSMRLGKGNFTHRL